jgi:PAS domain S-box-containing protein
MVRSTGVINARPIPAGTHAQPRECCAKGYDLGEVLARAADAILLIGESGVIEEACGAVASLFGWRPEELIGQPVTVLMNAPDAAAHLANIQKVLDTGKTGIMNVGPRTLKGRHRRGTPVDFELTIGEAWVDGRRKFVGVCRDATEKLRTERSLRRANRALAKKVSELEQARTELLSEQAKSLEMFKASEAALRDAEKARHRLELAARMAEVHVWEMDYKNKTLEKAGAEDDFFEKPITYEMLRDDIYCTVHPDDRAGVVASFEDEAGKGGFRTVEHRINRSDGREIWAVSAVETVLDEKGRTVRLIGALRNITRRRAARIALLQARDEAEAANRAKTAFLATMSHEIRTPLNGVLGMAQAMVADDLPLAQRERLDVLRQSGEALLAILNDVLDLSKIEAGKLELEQIEFDLDETTRGVHSAFTDLAHAKGLSFGLDTRAAAGVYRGDPTRLRQILFNLISNALKFTEAGKIDVVLSYADNRLRLVVSDTGLGMSAETLASLFNKFTQADSTTTRRFGGTGLGLAICRELAEFMGGSIEAASQLGEGSKFTVVLPFPRVGPARASARPIVRSIAAPRAAGAAHSAATAPLKVLAAEDNRINQQVLQTLLRQIGMEPVIVQNGREAVAAWRTGAWDLILMDIHMPEMDGPTATRRIRAAEIASGRPRTPIIALTANAMTHQIAEYLAAGMDGVVTKPIEVSKLFETLQRALDARPATRLQDDRRSAG